jgi:hypothetical protein
MSTITGETRDSDKWVMEYPNGEEIKYTVGRISQIDHFYMWKEKMLKDAKIKMRQIKLDKLCVKEQK